MHNIEPLFILSHVCVCVCFYQVEADADKSGLSDYELARLENMKAINEKFNEIFSEVSHLLPTGESETSSAERTPERRNSRKARTGQKGTWTTR